MRVSRPVVGVVVACAALLASPAAEAGRLWCRGPVLAPAWNCGGIGYSSSVVRWGWGGGWGCGVRPVHAGWCGPSWCGPSWCGPCWPGGWRGGWCGTTTWRAVDSVFLSVPAGGGATFFSGAVVPAPVWGCGWGWGWGYPTNWMPGWQVGPGGAFWTPCAVPLPAGVGPQFGPAGVMPFLGLSASTPVMRPSGPTARVLASRDVARPVIAAAPRAAGRAVAMRASNTAARLRAARLVEIGDRHLREAGEDAGRIGMAVDAYRRAALIAQDQPDIHVRHALALVGLGRAGPADEALSRAVAVDGRLAAPPAARGGDAPIDAVFGDRPAGEPTPLAARGAAILREIAAAGEAPAVTRLADMWARRWQAPGAALAATR